MKILAVHPGPLMYTKIFLRLEPLGLELVAGAARQAGHDVRLIDLQVEQPQDYFRMLKEWCPDVVALSCNYLPNVPEIIDLAKMTKASFAKIFIVAGGHSLSFVAREVLEHAEGAIDAIVKGEGEPVIGPLLNAIQHDRSNVHRIPGVVTGEAEGPP
ncbi:MAG TPA: cobalamin B12-binding domain-containing protein, partial [Nitrospirales bacterium]|nr:cobalamin B12-binding domain-containing protein [Nitrospirales bacterium]